MLIEGYTRKRSSNTPENYENGVLEDFFLLVDYIKNEKHEFKIANRDFTVSIVSKRQLKKHVPNHEIKNFYRFTLAPYDMNLKRLYYQYRWDQKILKGYKKYNEKK